MRPYLAALVLAPIAAPVLVPAAALAQSAAVIAVGNQVVDTKGGAVGVVTSIRGDVVTIKTDRHEVALPKASFTPSEGKLFFGMTQAELNAATDQALAASAASLVPGATVKGAAGTAVGTLDSIDTEFATIKLESGKLVRIPRAGIVGSSDGAVIGLTAGQLEAQVVDSGDSDTE